MNKISVITICYNCKDVIEKTIKSVIGQTYHNLEYIIVDGASNDGTTEIIDQYKDYIFKIICEPDNGIYDAINKGVKAATGDWICCMNAGDIFFNNKVLENTFQLNIAEDKLFLYSDYWSKTKDGDMVHQHTNRSKGNILHQSSIYKKQLHNSYGYYVVTKPYTVSDLLFFLSIPEIYFLKIPYDISINDCGGVSQEGSWCKEKALALRVVFNKETINSAFFKYWKWRVHSAIPYSWRRWFRKNILMKFK